MRDTDHRSAHTDPPAELRAVPRKSPDAPNDPPPTNAATAALLREASRHLHTVLAERLDEQGLSTGLHDLLRIVAACDWLPQHEIQHMLAREHSAPALIMTAMANGWVRRWRAPADRRRYALHLTEAGTHARLRGDAVEREVHSDLLAALAPEELAALHTALTKIIPRPAGTDARSALPRAAGTPSPRRTSPARPRSTPRPRTPDGSPTRPPTR
ncbi:MarR family winged helix-turn-helix transcriptional regulator [Yinghuangia sp. YIM S09857]|uniref:MarR family winged helix-turn-helix transcriptional regulator n=1 Tax=Yinghuangia sp. YIM S09857 TaxID=3436929 RepID=UPI003F5350BC